jgi:hypothetical protein
VQRIIAGFGKALIGRDRQEHVRGLHADLEIEEIVILEDLRVVERGFDHRLRARLAIALEQLALEAAGVDADAHGAAMILRRLHHLAHALGVADIAGVDAQARGASLGRFDAALVVEVDVRDDRYLRRLHDLRQRRGRFFVRA